MGFDPREAQNTCANLLDNMNEIAEKRLGNHRDLLMILTYGFAAATTMTGVVVHELREIRRELREIIDNE